jgi:hypothetical protein
MRPLVLLLLVLGFTTAQAKLRASAQQEIAAERALTQSCVNNGGCQNGSKCK